MDKLYLGVEMILDLFALNPLVEFMVPLFVDKRTNGI